MRRFLLSLVLLSVVAGGTLAVASTTPSSAPFAAATATPCKGTTCTLTVHLNGSGHGGVNSEDGKILCLSDGAPGCSANYTKGGKPTLDANPGPGSVFSYWGGDCSGRSRPASSPWTPTRPCTRCS